jgi:FkbM family methyltransferase
MPTNPPHLRPPALSSGDALRAYAEYKAREGRGVFCFQVGANDGKINDPVYPFLTNFGWRGLLVEPLPNVFEQGLRQTYAGNAAVALANVAIAANEGVMPLYRISFTDARWATGLSSFRRETLVDHIDSGYVEQQAALSGAQPPADRDSWIEAVSVRTTTVDRLLKEHGVTTFDVLCIDTEGFDYEVLKLVDIAKYRPELVFYESKNLSDSDYEASKALFEGYRLFWHRGDTFAVRKGSDAERAVTPLRSPLRRIRKRLSRMLKR